MNAACVLLLLTNAVMAAWILQCQRRIARLDDERGRALKALGLNSLNLERAHAHAGAGMGPSLAQEAQVLKLAALGKLMSGIAHEITNPLGVILGFAQSAVKNLKAEDPLFMAMKSIEREAGRCKNILHTLLFFSRLENGGRRSCSLNSVVEAALVMIEPYVKTKSVELRKELSADLPEIKVNPTQIQQILINLSANAADAMPKGGVLCVRTVKGLEKDNEYVELQVQDNGLGIPEEIQKRIFEPYFTTKEDGRGTGLGLSLVCDIVKQHGGSVRLESQASKGTLFRIFLPLGPDRK